MDKNYDELKEWVKGLDVREIFDLSTNNSLSGIEKSIAYNVGKKIQAKYDPSFKQLKSLYRAYSKQQEATDSDTLIDVKGLEAHASRAPVGSAIKHLCLRTAWHDNKWNGRICKDPEANIHCIGEYSLLSERVRRRRDAQLESSSACRDCKADSEALGDYQPPCFWSINAYGSETLRFKHDNPAADDFPLIDQELKPYSLISWPFKLSFVKDTKEKEKYRGNYYPKEIFENRIRIFRRYVEPAESVVFTYCNYSNPVSGEEMKYLVTGCALLEEQGEPQYFDVTPDQLANKARELSEPNFPTMNWALRYTLDVEGTGVRLPYHEYLDIMSGPGTDDVLSEIAVIIDEPELRGGFTYVARHIDDDQAIYLLMKMRRSLLKVQEHGFVDGTQTAQALARVEDLIGFTWQKRGYLPGLYTMLQSISAISENYSNRLEDLYTGIDLAEPETLLSLRAALAGENGDFFAGYEDLYAEIKTFLLDNNIESDDFLQLASIGLTRHQFRRIQARHCADHSISDVCRNPYLLVEDYVPQEDLEDALSGEKIDGRIDLYKVDIALLPLALYQKPIPEYHSWRATDYRRLRAVIIQILQGREGQGDCFLPTDEIAESAESYALFYRSQTPYTIREYLVDPNEKTANHYAMKLVLRNWEGSRYYYLKTLYDDEVFVGDFINGLFEQPDHALSAETLKSGISHSAEMLAKKIGERFNSDLFRSERERLYAHVAGKSFFIITGSPGAGKSYELLKLVEFFSENSEVSLVVSLTGKAVIRLRNNDEGFCCNNAKTIDKFLVEQKNVKAQAARTIIHNLIIDEASMVDLPKLAESLRCIETKHLKRLILVGDPNQLPPIGFGKPFADTVELLAGKPETYADHMVQLEVNCRAEMSDEFIEFTRVFSNESKLAERYLVQTAEEGELCGGDIGLAFWLSREDLHHKLSNKVTELLAEQGLAPDALPALLGIRSGSNKPTDLERFQVLSPYRSGYYGASGLNMHFQDALRPDTEFARQKGDVVFKLLDKVMHTQNEYDGMELRVANGSLGAIVQGRKVFFVDQDKPISIDSLRSKDKLELAYAITVHKSQGSGFNHVFIILPEKAQYTTRELLYTALTRARNRVTIFVQQGEGIPAVPKFLQGIQSRSAVVTRRTSLFSDGAQPYAYTPQDGVIVKSRVEYIIYRKLLEAQKEYGSFTFSYEDTYEIRNKNFDIHPDFVLRFADGRVIYWEHLGRVNSRSYMRDWDRRRNLYEDQSDFGKVMTTDELRGISDEKIQSIVGQVVSGSPETEDNSDRYSHLHFSLR